MKKSFLFLIFPVFVYSFGLNFCQNIDDSKSQIKLINIKNDKSKENMHKWLNAEFGLKPYRANYLLPFGYSNRKYQSNIPRVDYDNKEAEIQVSLKLKVADDLLSLGENYYLSYTHQAFWQIYIYSAPFRESLYNPEGFVVFPISDRFSIFQLRSLKVALAHKSNGQPDTTDIRFSNGDALGNLSRSINYFYYTLRLQHRTLLTDITLLTPLPGSYNLSDNPDLMDYLGYTKIKFTYFLHKNMLSLMLRGNLKTRKGALETTYSYPLRKDAYLYMKFFTGYVESLIDYNKFITKFSIGFSFSR